jgi:aromatic ring-opening dioxygenase catalytic subunit (LigB family)
MMDQVGHLYAKLDASLRALPSELPATPKALLVITAHWEGASSCCPLRPSRR